MPAAGVDVGRPDIERRIVRQDRTDAGQDRAGTSAQPLHVAARFRARNPLALAARHRNRAVDTGRDLEPHVGPAPGHAADETLVQCDGQVFHESDLRRNPGLLEFCESATINLPERIPHGRHHAGHTGIDERVHAGRCFAVMRTRLEGDIGCRPSSKFAGFAKRVDFGVRLTGRLVPAFADDLVVRGNDTTDHRVGMCGIAATRRELQRTRHVRTIQRGKHDQPLFLPSNSGSKDICSRLAAVSDIFCRRLISSSNSVMSWKRR